MPFLIRLIAQRVALFILGFLAFLGFNPDINVPTQAEILITDQNQKEIVRNILTEESIEEANQNFKKIEQEASKIIDQISIRQEKVQNVIEQAIHIPQVETDSGSTFTIKENFYENVVVNIVCVNKTLSAIKMTTGSGVIVSPSGIVLTNSHVANTFLFDDKSKDSYKDCSIRRENIPTYGFNAELVYLSEKWLKANQEFFTQNQPRGSGEDDYALLAITSNTNPALPLPQKFDYVEMFLSEKDISQGDGVVVAAYPGIHTGIFEVDSAANLKKITTRIADLVTFGGNTVDIISSEPNEAARGGSSGGGFFKDGKLLGIIVTTDDAGDGNYANAITASYIARDFKKEEGVSFDNYVSKNKKTLISEYKNDIAKLKTLVADFF